MEFDSIVVGCGFAGAVIARELAEKGKKVLVVEKRDHIGGNCFDCLDENGILIHKYGPHIFHTNRKRVFSWLSKFTEWYPYSHEVVGNIHGSFLPIPFNLNSLHMAYGEEKGARLEAELLAAYGPGTKVPILTLMDNPSEEIRELAQFVYENVFLKYTMKQWGQKPEEVDSSVTARVPVLLSYDNRYFQDEYQSMPLDGFTPLFERILSHGDITLLLGNDANRHLKIVPGEAVFWDDEPFHGDFIYTGPVDELFSYRLGQLPYRSLHFRFEHLAEESFQSKSVVNYTISEEYTRITEFKHFTGQEIRRRGGKPVKGSSEAGTTILKEYPVPYTGENGEVRCYAILNEENRRLYESYTSLLESFPKFHLLGRLAEYKYYNMDAIIEKALLLAEDIIQEG